MNKQRGFTLLIALVVMTCIPLITLAASTVQIPASGWDYLGGEDSPATWSRLGQRLVLADAEVLAIGYRVSKVGFPIGNVTLSIRDSKTDDVLWSQVWSNAGNLPDANNNTYIKLDIMPSLKVDGDVRICVEYYGGNATDYVQAGYYAGNKTSGQWYTNYVNYATDASGWHDIGEAEEAAYYMSYISGDTEPENGNTSSGGVNWVLIGAIGGIVLTLFGGAAILRKTKKEAE